MKHEPNYIQMIFWTDEKGTITPIRFRIKNEDSGYMVVVINKVLKRGRNKFAGIEMLELTCEATVNNTKKQFELRYELLTCRWFVISK